MRPSSSSTPPSTNSPSATRSADVSTTARTATSCTVSSVADEGGRGMRKASVLAVAALFVAVSIGVLALPAGAHRNAAAPVKIFVIAPVATPIQNYPDAQAGAEAAAQAINKAGGIRGRQIEIGFCNTQSAVNQAVA